MGKPDVKVTTPYGNRIFIELYIQRLNIYIIADHLRIRLDKDKKYQHEQNTRITSTKPTIVASQSTVTTHNLTKRTNSDFLSDKDQQLQIERKKHESTNRCKHMNEKYRKKNTNGTVVKVVEKICNFSCGCQKVRYFFL